MSEEDTFDASSDQDTSAQPNPADTMSRGTGDGKDWKAEAERFKAESRKWEDRAKANGSAAKELADLKASTQTDHEKAVTEAEKRGRTAALAQSAGRLATAELRAAAAGKVPKEALDGFLAYADLSKFLNADGEPDSKAIETVVKQLAGPDKGVDFDGGARKPASKPTDMNALIRQAAGLG